jgi:hypothetical protein
VKDAWREALDTEKSARSFMGRVAAARHKIVCCASVRAANEAASRESSLDDLMNYYCGNDSCQSKFKAIFNNSGIVEAENAAPLSKNHLQIRP